MDPTNTTNHATNHLVQQSYDKIAGAYASWAETRPSLRLAYTQKLLDLLPRDDGARVLDMGCGAGIPVTQCLCGSDKVAEVVGVDISEKMIELARDRCSALPSGGKATFAQVDMTTLSFEDGSIDGVTAFFSLFHLPGSEQPAMLRKIYKWLQPGGVLVCNFNTTNSSSTNVWDYFEAEMFWSGLGVEGSKDMLIEDGFEVLEAEVLEAEGEVEGDPDHGVSFLWVLARKGGRQDDIEDVGRESGGG